MLTRPARDMLDTKETLENEMLAWPCDGGDDTVEGSSESESRRTTERKRAQDGYLLETAAGVCSRAENYKPGLLAVVGDNLAHTAASLVQSLLVGMGMTHNNKMISARGRLCGVLERGGATLTVRRPSSKFGE